MVGKDRNTILLLLDRTNILNIFFLSNRRKLSWRYGENYVYIKY